MPAHDLRDPARCLYASVGFQPCSAFGDYVEDPYSVFMSLSLARG